MILHLLCLSLLWIPLDSVNEKKCFFSVSRTSRLEKVERSKAMQVSTGTCSATLYSADQLMTINPARQYFGAYDQFDLVMIRGAGEYRMSPDNADELKSDILICERHVRELGYYWSNKDYGHLRYHKTATRSVPVCSYPIEPHNVHIDRPGKAFYLTREETKSFLAASGIHLHAGLAVCKEHYDMIISRIAEAKEESCDMTFTEDHQNDVLMEDEKREKSALQNAFFSFCREADIDRVCPKTKFEDYTKDTQTRKVRNLERIWWTALELVAPGSETELWHRVCKTGNYRAWDNFGNEAANLILPEISHLYMLANDARTRDIILSQAAGPMTYTQLLPYFPGLSPYRFNKAKRIWASQEIPPEVKKTVDRWSMEKTMHFVNYMASPHLMMQLPYGLRKAKLSSGEKIDVPNVIRNFGQAETIRNYRAFMENQGLSHLVYSDSTMIRMLRAAPATTRHSLTCVDSFKAASYEAFDGIEEMIDRLVGIGKMSKEEGKDKWFEFLEIRLYLKHDYSLHVKQDSRVADHSLLYALSDPYNAKFAVQPAHEHNLQDMSDYLTSLLENDPANAMEYNEMIFNLGNYRDAVFQLKAHEMLPTKCYETQCEYFGKKGLSWMFSHVLANISDTLVQHISIHMVDNDPQDSQSTVSIVTALLKELKVAGITAVHIRSDNAANFHCAPTMGSILSISRETEVEILDWSFSEIQDGKGPADRGCANAKFKIRKEVKNKGKVQSQKDMFDILIKEPLMPGVSVFLAEVTAPSTPPTPSVITRVTDYSHFKNEGDHLRVWKYFGVGKGEVFSKLHSNAGIYKELNRGGFLADAHTESSERHRIKNRLPGTYWHYDPKALQIKETGDRDQDSAVELEPEMTKDGKKGLSFACWCGSTFLNYGNYLNHVDHGVHKIHPIKTTNIDETLKYYKRCLEDMVQVKSLVPLQDAIDSIYDKTVSVLAMGWGLRSAKKHSRYPEKTKKMIQAFAVERKSQGKRVDPEEAFRRMKNDKTIDLHERMSKEQVKRYINRLIFTRVKKTVVIRAKRSDVEMDDENAYEWKVEEEEEGEWEIEEECEIDEEGIDDFDLYYNHFEKDEEKIFKD